MSAAFTGLTSGPNPTSERIADRLRSGSGWRFRDPFETAVTRLAFSA